MSLNNKEDVVRVNFFDGQRITESDLDTEQQYIRTMLSSITLDFHSSGILNPNLKKPKVLLDTSKPGHYAENLSKTTMESGKYDGKPINVDVQPSDLEFGNRLEIELANSNSMGSQSTKILIIGRVYNALNETNDIKTEVIEFKNNYTKLTKYYYIKVYGIIFNNFSGGTGATHFSSSEESINNLNSDTALIIKESEPLKVFSNTLNCYQDESPNIDLMNFISSSVSRTINQEIEDAIGAEGNLSEVYLDFTGKDTLKFEKDGNISVYYGQKFLSNSNNIQKFSVLLSVKKDEALNPNYYDWTGELVFSVYDLSTELSKCSSDVYPERPIDYDPEITPIAQISYDQDDLKDRGIILGEDPKVVDIDFSDHPIANPNLEPLIEKDKYYVLMISRSGSNSSGEIKIEKGYYIPTRKEEQSFTLNPEEKFGRQTSRAIEFDPSTKQYIDDKDGSLWHKVYSSSVEITDGICYTGDGFFVTVPKTYEFVGGSRVLYYQRNIDLKDLSGGKNYLILESEQKFLAPNVHPRTGNFVYTRIQDAASLRMISQNDIDAYLVRETPIILASVIDDNTRSAQAITGTFTYAGYFDTNYFTIISPSTEVLNSNLVGRNFVPDTGCACENAYKIVKVQCNILKAGDLNSDGELTNADMSLLLDIAGNTINSEDTERKLFGGELLIEDFFKSDLNDDGTVDGFDIELLEDAIDGYSDFSIANNTYSLRIYVESTNQSDYQVLFTDATSGSITTAATAKVKFVVDSEEKALAIRIGDTVTVPTGSDAGTYKVISKTTETDGLTVTVEVSGPDGETIAFLGSSGFNVTITSKTKTNIFIDNFDLITTPYTSKDYSISLSSPEYNQDSITLCDLRRFMEFSYIDDKQTSCECVSPTCNDGSECLPIRQNEKYLPGNLLLSGEVLDDAGKTHHLDYEYASITMPLPPGSIEDCQINIYETFIKSKDNTCYTEHGYPAMRYSDGTYVGCEDSGSDTDITKGKVKITSAIASLYVDGLIVGYATDEQTIYTGTDDDDVATNGTAIVSFATSTEEEAQAIQGGDLLTIPSDFDDSGVYKVVSITIDPLTGLDVAIEVSGLSCETISFTGSSGFNVIITRKNEIPDKTLEISADEIFEENFLDYSTRNFGAWGETIGAGTSIAHIDGANEPAVFGLTTQTADTSAKLAMPVVNAPLAPQELVNDFIVDYEMTRAIWPNTLTSGTVSFHTSITVTNASSTANLRVGFRENAAEEVKIFYAGEIYDNSANLIYSFDYTKEITGNLGDSIMFRIRRENEVISAYYHNPTIELCDSASCDQYMRIYDGDPMGTHPGAGTATYLLEMSQTNTPNTGIIFQGKVYEFVARSTHTSVVADDTIKIGRAPANSETDRVLLNFPLNLNSRTNIISASMTLTPKNTKTIDEYYNVIPIDSLDVDNMTKYSNNPQSEVESLITSFMVQDIEDGVGINVDISSIIIGFLANSGHISGFHKGLIIEPLTDGITEFEISSDITITVKYEDISTGVVFKVGTDLSPTSGILSMKTKNILYDKTIKENRTTLKFGVFLKKAGFINKDIEVSLNEIEKIGIGTCIPAEEYPDEEMCYFITGDTKSGTFVNGPFNCVFNLGV